MLATELSPQYKRRSLRRAVSLECEVESDLWEGQAPFRVTDLSEDGLWLRTGLPIECGEQVLVSFAPPRWPSPKPIVAMASVVRVALSRRRSDEERSGMALKLLDLDPTDAQLLRATLRGLPPPLRVPAVIDATSLVVVDQLDARMPMTSILKHDNRFRFDGRDVTFVAAGALLTGGRASKQRIHLRASETEAVVESAKCPPALPSLRLAS